MTLGAEIIKTLDAVATFLGTPETPPKAERRSVPDRPSEPARPKEEGKGEMIDVIA